MHVAKPTIDPTAHFFAELAERAHEPLLRKADGQRPLRRRRRAAHAALARHGGGGQPRSDDGNADADCIVHADKAVFDKLAAGRLNAVAAVLRGDLEVEGDWRLLVRMQRLFPGPRALSPTEGDVVSDGLVKILDGNTFVVSDSNGDIEASLTDPTGLFSFDTRFLSRWVLTVNGERLNPLSVDDLQYFETRFFLVPGTGTVYIDAKLSVIRQRAVATGFHEELTILNHFDKPVSLDGADRCGLRFRRPVRGEGRACEERSLLDQGRAEEAHPRLRPRTVRPGDCHHRDQARASSTPTG